MIKKIVSCILIICMLVPLLSAMAMEPPYVFSEGYAETEFCKKLLAVQLTGNQRVDIVKVALSQVGYHEGELGDYSGSDTESEGNCTEYNRFYYGWDASGDNYAWCAVFLTWCARQAGISRNIIRTYNRSNATAFGFLKYTFDSRKPMAGDIAFIDKDAIPDPDHVAIVYRVDEAYIYTVEGNADDAVRLRRYRTMDGVMIDDDDQPIEEAYILHFGVPWYSTGDEAPIACTSHLYSLACEDFCALCGEKADLKYIDEDLNMASASGKTLTYKSPYKKSANIISTIIGVTQVNVVKSVENTIGEKWYQLDDGGFAKAEEMCYVYSKEQLAPTVEVLTDEEEKVSVQVNCVEAGAKLYFSIDDSEPDIKSTPYAPGIVLSARRDFGFKVKAVYRGVESESVIYGDAKPEQEQEQEPEKTAAGMENFKYIRTYFGLYQDIAAENWYYPNVVGAYELGLLNGYSIGEFGVNGGVTEAQAIAVAARLHSIYHTGKTDIPQRSDSPWSERYIAYALENKLIEAAPEAPDAPVSRLQFVSIIASALPQEALEPIVDVKDGAITDIDSNSSYVNTIYTLYRAGVLRGTGQLLFKPEDGISRVEAAAIVTRLALPELRAT